MKDPAKLYTMIQENIKTGARTTIYGHATHNVMEDFWQAYVDAEHRVIIQEYVEDENNPNYNRQFGYRSWSPEERAEYNQMWAR